MDAVFESALVSDALARTNKRVSEFFPALRGRRSALELNLESNQDLTLISQTDSHR